MASFFAKNHKTVNFTKNIFLYSTIPQGPIL